jgi:hypothetical protein
LPKRDKLPGRQSTDCPKENAEFCPQPCKPEAQDKGNPKPEPCFNGCIGIEFVQSESPLSDFPYSASIATEG